MPDLSTELNSGPLANALAPYILAGDDAAICEIMNTKSIQSYGMITSHDIREYLMVIDVLLSIEDSTSISCREAARALDIFDSFDLSNSSVLVKLSSILDGLISDNLVPAFTLANKNTILSMGNKLISRADQLGMHIDIPTIAIALRG